METLKEVLRKIGKFSLTNKSEFEALVKNSLAKEQTEEIKKNQKRMPEITDRMKQNNGEKPEQILQTNILKKTAYRIKWIIALIKGKA